MGKFAFIIHPLSLEDVYRYEPKLKMKNPSLTKSVMLKWFPPVIVKEVEFTSPQGVSAAGLIISLGVLPEHFVSLKRCEIREVMSKLEQAARLAVQEGASMIGLGALTAVIGHNGEFLAERLDVAVTSGNS